MGKHDRFSWDTADNYFKNRVDSLQEQLENAQKQVALKDARIDRLEKAFAELTMDYARLQKAFIQEATRNVEV